MISRKFNLKNFNYFFGNSANKSEILSLIRTRNNKILISGPTGVGKTSLAYHIAKKLNFKLVEVNCALEREPEFFKSLTKIQNFDVEGREMLLLIDDIDTVTSQEIFSLISRILETTNARVILTCISDEIIPQRIKNQVISFRFEKLNAKESMEMIDLITLQEGIKLSRREKIKLISLGQGDIRALFNLIEFRMGKPRVETEKPFSLRARLKKITSLEEFEKRKQSLILIDEILSQRNQHYFITKIRELL